MRTVGAFIAIIGVLIFITRAPGVIVPRTYRRFVLDLFEKYPKAVQWVGRVLLLYAALFSVVTYVNFPQLTELPVVVAVWFQLVLFIGGTFLQFPAAAGEVAASFIPEDADITRLILFLASALGAFIGAYGVLLMLEA